jgi:starch-binding outer membrane protein, SusD/RagB family
MNLFKIKPILLTLSTAALFLTTACEIEPVQNPNGPTLESVESGATLADLRLLAHGLEAVMRVDMEFYYQTVSIVGREYYDLNGTDPRYTGELLGEQGAELDNNGFLTTRTFAARYKAIRNAELLIKATQNANAGLDQQEENSFLGYAQTMKAYALLLALNHQYENGCRLDVSDPDNLGPFVSYQEGLAGISQILDNALTQLSNGGDRFLFNLSPGFAGFNTPEEFGKFNRAIAARVELYRNNKTAVLDRISKSFMNMAGDLDAGVYHSFGAGGNDILNPLYNVPNNDLYTVHPSWLNEADANDMRVAAKTTPLDPNEITLPVQLAGLSGDTQVSLVPSNISPFPIIRNEELILIYAEANIGSDNNEAVNAINAVRNAAGVGPYGGATDDASLVNEVLKQRRYSLFGEGHRWIDMRRYNRIGEIPTDRAGDKVHVQFPRPVTEG